MVIQFSVYPRVNELFANEKWQMTFRSRNLHVRMGAGTMVVKKMATGVSENWWNIVL